MLCKLIKELAKSNYPYSANLSPLYLLVPRKLLFLFSGIPAIPTDARKILAYDIQLIPAIHTSPELLALQTQSGPPGLHTMTSTSMH